MNLFSRFLCSISFALLLFGFSRCGQAVKAPLPAVNSFTDSLSIVKQDGKFISITGKWERKELQDAFDRIELSDGHCILIWYCSYNDTLSRNLLNAAEKSLLGKSVRITGLFQKTLSDTCAIKERPSDPHAIGYLDMLRSVEADESNVH